MEKTFIIVSTIIFFLLGVAWEKNSLENFLMKVVLIVMFLVGIILMLRTEGLLIPYKP